MSFSKAIKTVPVIGIAYTLAEDVLKFAMGDRHDLEYLVQKAQYQAEMVMFWNDIVRAIVPDSIEIKKEWLELGTTKVKVLIVGQSQGSTEGFRPDAAYKMMKDVRDINVPGAATFVSMSGVPIPTMEAQGLLRGARFYNEKNQADYVKGNELGTEDHEINLTHQSINRSIELLYNNEEKMFYGNYIISIFAENDAVMDTAFSKVEAALLGNDILAVLPVDRMWEGFMSGQPYPWLEDFTAIRMFSTFMSLISPTVSADSPLTRENEGIYIGDEIKANGGFGKEIFWNYKSPAAPHLLIAGATGNGKTYATIDFLIQLFLLGRDCWYITKKVDDDTDYKNVVSQLPGGAIIQLGQRPGKKNLNPFHIIWSKQLRDISEYDALQIYNNQKILASKWIQRYLGVEYSHRMDAYIDKCIDQLYEDKKISPTDVSTWFKAIFPLPGDLYKKLNENLKTLTGDDRKTCSSMIAKLYVFKHGGRYDFINRQTDIDFNNVRFGVIEYDDIPEELQESTNILLAGVLAWQVAVVGDEGFTVAIDEGGVWVREKDLTSILFRGVTQWRSRHGQLIFTFHQPDDIRNAGMSEVMKFNCHTKMIFPGGIGNDVQLRNSIIEFMGLPEHYAPLISKMQKWQAVMRVDNNVGLVQVVAPDDVDRMIHGQKLEGMENIGEEEEKEEEVKQELVMKPMYVDFIKKNKYLLEVWLSRFSDKALRDAGYRPFSLQRMLDTGKLRCWAHKDLIKTKTVDEIDIELFDNGELKSTKEKEYFENQRPEHYSSNCQLGAFLIELGWQNVKVNHHHSVDVEGEFNGVKCAWELEMDGTHTSKQIEGKFNRARAEFDRVFFVYVTASKARVIEAVGEYVKGGCGIPRGGNLRNQVEELTEELKNLPQNEAENSQEKAPTDELSEGSEPKPEIQDVGASEDIQEAREQVNILEMVKNLKTQGEGDILVS